MNELPGVMTNDEIARRVRYFLDQATAMIAAGGDYCFIQDGSGNPTKIALDHLRVVLQMILTPVVSGSQRLGDVT